MNARDAIEFFLAGASAIQVGTANFIDPLSTIKIITGIETYLKENKYESIQEIIGNLHL
jgi:dihydroorotate dehydrogenase (NAD+) catalytic subunit